MEKDTVNKILSDNVKSVTVYNRSRYRPTPSRPHDYIYDPLFTVCSARDHQRCMEDAARKEAEFRKCPVLSTMFTDFPNKPRARLELLRPDRVPDFIDKTWEGRQRPLVPFLQPVIQTVQFALDGEPGVETETKPYKVPLPSAIAPVTRTQGTQTDYRESETQTLPWSPPFITQDGENPELLTLAILSYGNSLPAGVQEEDLIERARIKRAWDMYLEDIIMEPLDYVVEEESRKYVRDLAVKVDQAAQEAQTRGDIMEREEIIAHMIHHYMLPEVDKRMVREKMKARQQKYLLAAHDAIYQETDSCEPQTSDIEQIKLEPTEALSTEKKSHKKSLRLIAKVEEEISRPETSEVKGISDDDEESYQTAILFQKILRGRAVQTLMYNGKNECQELLDEIKSTQALQQAGMDELAKMRQEALGTQREKCLTAEKLDKVEEVVSKLGGETISSTLSFLSKELWRLQDERTAHALSLFAERERHRREAGEVGQRQAEERIRREHDEMNKQVLRGGGDNNNDDEPDRKKTKEGDLTNPARGIIGFENPDGFMCPFNGFIQILLGQPTFVMFCYDGYYGRCELIINKNSAFMELCNIVKQAWNGVKPVLSLLRFKEILNNVTHDFDVPRQEDVSAVAISILNCLEEEIATEKKKSEMTKFWDSMRTMCFLSPTVAENNENFLSTYCKGEIMTIHRCQTCNRSEKLTEPFFVLDLPVTDEKYVRLTGYCCKWRIKATKVYRTNGNRDNAVCKT